MGLDGGVGKGAFSPRRPASGGAGLNRPGQAPGPAGRADLTACPSVMTASA